MTEKMRFEFSSLVKNDQDIAEIEFWGHDAGEFVSDVIEELEGIVKELVVKVDEVGKE